MNRNIMYLKESKIDSFYNNRAEYIGEDIYIVENFEFYDLQKKEYVNKKIGDYFKGRNDYFEISFTIKDKFEHQPEESIFGYFDLGKTDPGFNEGFEALLEINKEKIQAIDQYHKLVLINDTYNNNAEYKISLWTGFDGGGKPRELQHKIKNMKFIKFQKDELQLLFLFEILYETSKTIAEDTEVSIFINDILFDIYEYFVIEKKESHSKKLKSIIKKLEENEYTNIGNVNLHVFGHAHIDLAWLWTKKNAIEKSIRTYSTMLNLMDRYEEFNFLQSTPQMYQWIKEREPELYTKIKQKISEGQFIPEGGMWVEADCNIPNSESLARQIIYGKKFFKDEFNIDSKVLWIPDVFGYSWSIPQLLKQSGIDYFMTTKISWNQYNKMPSETFYWKGLDGSKILTHFMTTPEMNREYTWHKTYTTKITAKQLKSTWETYEDKEINSDLPVAYGYGDGGGGVTFEMLEKLRLFKFIPSVPKINHTNVLEAMKKIENNIVATNKYVHEWDEELYLEYHRGTYTTQAKIKKLNREFEIKLRELEYLLCTVVDEGKRKNLAKDIEQIWKNVLTNQFHDIIPGSSIKEVYDELWIECDQISNRIQQTKNEMTLTKNENKVTIINTSSFAQCGYIETSSQEYGNEYYEVFGRRFVKIDRIEKLRTIEINSENCLKQNNIVVDQIDSKVFDIRLNENNDIIYLYNKKSERLISDEFVNKLIIYDDYPHNFDAWDIDLDYLESKSSPKFVTGNIVKVNSDIHKICNEYVFNDSKIYQEIIINDYDELISIYNKVVWNESHKLLRVENAFAINTKHASYETQFGTIKRPNNWNTSWDIAKFEVCGHSFADISENNFGVSLINDCKYGYSVYQNIVSLSLLRSTKYPDYEADMGTHEFSYHIYSHNGVLEQSDVYAVAEKVNGYVQMYKNLFVNKLPCNVQQVLDTLNFVKVSSIKPAFDNNGIIIRCYEYLGGSYTITLPKDVIVFETDLLEEVVNKEKISILDFHPFEIKTIYIKS